MKNFAEELRKVQPQIKALIFSRIYDKTDANDVLQNTNLALINKKNEWNPIFGFLPWAMKFANFQIKCFFTKTKRNKEDSFAPESFGFQLHLIDEKCPLDHELKKELYLKQIKLINTIKENGMGKKEKSFFELSLQGASKEYIMKKLTLKKGAYYQMQARIINKIKKYATQETK